MIKTNIKMRVNQQQLLAISSITNRVFFKYDYKFIFIKDNDVIELNSDEQHFNIYPYEEIDADLFIKTNGTCEETYNEKYIKDHQPKDLESALKKIETLHIALNKKVEKNKNQALEITKLLEQKEEYKQNIDMVLKALNNTLKELTTKNEELQNRLKQLNSSGETANNTMSNYVDDLHTKLKEKDTIILYLESKLK